VGLSRHSLGRVGTDLLQLLALAANLFWIGLRGVMRAGVESAIVWLVAVSKQLRRV
jgi:hypothetical protein